MSHVILDACKGLTIKNWKEEKKKKMSQGRDLSKDVSEILARY